MTASTRTVTLSPVMPSWEGTGIVMICMFTFSRRSAIGINIVSPGPAEAGITAEPEDDAAFELPDDLNIRSEPEHTDAERCGQCVRGLLLPMKRQSLRQKRVTLLDSPTKQTPVLRQSTVQGSDLGIIKHAWSEQRQPRNCRCGHERPSPISAIRFVRCRAHSDVEVVDGDQDAGSVAGGLVVAGGRPAMGGGARWTRRCSTMRATQDTITQLAECLLRQADRYRPRGVRPTRVGRRS